MVNIMKRVSAGLLVHKGVRSIGRIAGIILNSKAAVQMSAAIVLMFVSLALAGNSTASPADSLAVLDLDERLRAMQQENAARMEQLSGRQNALEQLLQQQLGGLQRDLEEQLSAFEALQERITQLQGGLNQSGSQIQGLEAVLQQQADSLAILQGLLAKQAAEFQTLLEASQAQFRETLGDTEEQLDSLSEAFSGRLSRATTSLWTALLVLGLVFGVLFLTLRRAQQRSADAAADELEKAEKRLTGEITDRTATLEQAQESAQKELKDTIQQQLASVNEALDKRTAELQAALDAHQQQLQEVGEAQVKFSEALEENRKNQDKEAVQSAKKIAELLEKQLALSKAAEAAAIPAEALEELGKLEKGLSGLDPSTRGLKTLQQSLKSFRKPCPRRADFSRVMVLGYRL